MYDATGAPACLDDLGPEIGTHPGPKQDECLIHLINTLRYQPKSEITTVSILLKNTLQCGSVKGILNNKKMHARYDNLGK